MDSRLLRNRISELSADKRAVFEKLLNRVKAADGAIYPRDRRLDPPPLSFAQQQLWILDRLAPSGWFYNESSALQLTYKVDVDALQRGINDIVRRHEALRTTFSAANGEPVQIIAPRLLIPLVRIDLAHMSPDDRDRESRRIAVEDAQMPFDLTRPPLLRAHLLRRADFDHVLLLTMHHIVFDGWSFTIFLRELSEAYEARATGRAPALPPLPIQYADYAVWQRRTLRADALNDTLAYWRGQLANLPILELPTDRPRPAVQRFRGRRHAVIITPSTCASLRALSARQGMTLFMTLLTVFKALLCRYSGQTDIVVGVPLANRHRTELEPLIGFFVNTLVMRADLSGDPSFAEALARVRKVTLDAFSHGDVPFEMLVEELHPRRDLSRNPLFQVTFQIYGAGDNEELGPPTIENAPSSFEVDAQTAKFDLRFDLADSAGGLAGFVEYDADLFDADTVANMVSHFERLLQSALADPSRRLSELEILASEERRHILIDLNQTTSEYPRDRCVHELFEAQVMRTPQAIALIFEDESITYDELNRRANRICHYLVRRGIAPGDAVGISSERSIEMVAGILGILKAGAAYVPVDLEDAPDRIGYLVTDAHVLFVLTRERQLFHLEDRGVRVIPLGLERQALDAEPDENPMRCFCGPESLAYVMYTSGSTGKPKGVCVPHRAIARLVLATTFFSASQDDIFLQFAPLSFDASTFEIWGALLNGARLALFPPYVPSLAELATSIERGVTVLWLTSALFHQMIDHHLASFSAVRQVIAGGDVVSPTHVRKLTEAVPGCTVTNGYGPTENTTFTCTFSATRPIDETLPFPIGRPISNTRVYVLDTHGNPVPAGVRGELFVGGDGLALGYLNDPELTAAKFKANHLPEEPGSHLYRTGDQVRYRKPGMLEFIGRLDHQVKIRGFRVELGEIESVLRRHSEVQDAVCVVSTGTDWEKRLLAYVVGDVTRVGQTELRRFLQHQLADYMVPSQITILSSLPLTASGKVDRAALPAADAGRPELEAPYTAPRNEVERTITGLWQQVLGVDKVGVNDNFFDLGGHSLLAVLLHNRLTEAFKKELSIVDLFRYPTVSALAKLLSAEDGKIVGRAGT